MTLAADWMIETDGLTRRFGELVAVDELHLQIRRGEIFGIVGPDGAGKTTALRLLCGLIDPTAGGARVAGRDVATQIGEVRDRIGYMPQQFGQYVDLTVEENLHFYADLYGVPAAERDELMDRLLRMTRMAEFRRRRAGKLSGGMKQKLALMCALLHRPEGLLLDEPTNGVDPVSRRDFWTILYGLVRDGLTVVISTAYLDEAERCNRVALMFEGRVIREAPPNELRRAVEADCFAVECSQPREARRRLAERPGVLSVEPSGSALHLFLEKGRDIEELVRDLEASGVAPAEARPIEPSLEDAFIALIRQEERTAPSGTAA